MPLWLNCPKRNDTYLRKRPDIQGVSFNEIKKREWRDPFPLFLPLCNHPDGRKRLSSPANQQLSAPGGCPSRFSTMKSKITEEFKDLFKQSVDWAKLEVEYIKLTAAEKLIILTSAMIMGALIMILLLPFFIMLMFSLVGVFRLIMSPPLAYLSVGGIVAVVILLIVLFRKPLIINPVARFVTKVIIEKHSSKKS